MMETGKNTGEPAPLPRRLIDAHNHLADDDPTGERLIELMEGASVETAVIMGTPVKPNERPLAAARRHPGRLVPGAYIDPRGGTRSLDELRRFHAEGVRIVKLFPNLGYYPDDDAFSGFFDLVAELGMAVLSHCGWLSLEFGVTAAYYSHPGRFEKLLRRYTDTVFIFAHMGGIAGFLEAIMLTTRTPNGYVDCSPGQGLWVLENAGRMAATVPPEKLLWGADCYKLAGFRDRARAALVALGFGPRFQEIYHDNAHGILKRIGALEAE